MPPEVNKWVGVSENNPKSRPQASSLPLMLLSLPVTLTPYLKVLHGVKALSSSRLKPHRAPESSQVTLHSQISTRLCS